MFSVFKRNRHRNTRNPTMASAPNSNQEEPPQGGGQADQPAPQPSEQAPDTSKQDDPSPTAGKEDKKEATKQPPKDLGARPKTNMPFRRKGAKDKSKSKEKDKDKERKGSDPGPSPVKKTLSIKDKFRRKSDQGGEVPCEEGPTRPNRNGCVCTRYARTEDHPLGAGVIFSSADPSSEAAREESKYEELPELPPKPTQKEPPKDEPADGNAYGERDSFPVYDEEEMMREVRRRDIEEGIDPPPGYNPPDITDGIWKTIVHHDHDEVISDFINRNLQKLTVPWERTQAVRAVVGQFKPALHTYQNQFGRFEVAQKLTPRRIHTQIDYIHCLVPDMVTIVNQPYYWGVMDRYEAEDVLEGKPEGTFLLRDSAQEDFLFSVSFRRYGRTLHARIEQWNHLFSFDVHDPAVYAAPTVCQLLEHYKNPDCCMFFEPMLTTPLPRPFTFPLQALCRSVICKFTSYDGINSLRLPGSLKDYLKVYHYKQRVRVRRFEMDKQPAIKITTV
ncbi:suppressor of cytokine signaling 5-like isoform X1 [Branchiostoma floridae]|uniref:Suppressor of cytokine signaling 5-like isoform X1 n=2 Tax=Branchiostoma floridae TaxID=7739 RepID=A0A9J7N7Y8_BRAFL|nr:suppressor of cytokine signaling 5-like isoform X1 [Branchiostoma floridae]